MRRALAWAAKGMDVADAFHLSLSEGTERFVSFDEAFVRRAKKIPTTPLVSAPASG